MAVDERLTQLRDRVGQRLRATAVDDLAQRREIALRLAIDERGEQRLLARKVLIDGADADARNLGDAVTVPIFVVSQGVFAALGSRLLGAAP